MNLQIVQQPNSESRRGISLSQGMSLSHVLQKEGIFLSAPCAGNGTCGACKVKVLQGELPVTQKDRNLLSEEELREGWRLACQAYPVESDADDGDEKSCVIYVPSENFSAVTSYNAVTSHNAVTSCNAEMGIAIDLGTTTIAYELFELKSGKTAQIFSSTNPQRSYGADVISRMEQSDSGRKDMLKRILRQKMRGDIGTLLKGMDPERVGKIAISANTAMVHLFMGYSCEGLGKYPFCPETLECIHTDAATLGLMDREIPVSISPGISAYVGGDILMGAASIQLGTVTEPVLFLDLGTNAEMLLTDGKGNAYVTSAPAGPAFEAANISCGVGSVAGAICGVDIQNGKTSVSTIGDEKPIGFCGSGILEAIYELRVNQIMDETGLLADNYFESGFPVDGLKITQQDIRQIQLAKSAVISAIRILLKAADMAAEDLNKIYLAGGFGFYLNVEKAIGIGLLPKEFAQEVKTVGNTSLKGTKDYLGGNLPEECIHKLKIQCKEIYLSNDSDFQKMFMENMNFE